MLVRRYRALHPAEHRMPAYMPLSWYSMLWYSIICYVIYGDLDILPFPQFREVETPSITLLATRGRHVLYTLLGYAAIETLYDDMRFSARNGYYYMICITQPDKGHGSRLLAICGLEHLKGEIY